MSSVSYGDSSCTLSAAQVSCDAMSEMAKSEYYKNKMTESYFLLDPSCERNQQLANREEEHFLQKSLGIARNVCFEKTAQFQQGPWESSFTEMVADPTRFEQWTRARGNAVDCRNRDIKCPPTPLAPFPGPCGFMKR